MAERAVTRVVRVIKAPRGAVYQAFVDPNSVAVWLAPNNMRSEVHHFDARVGGTFRISLTYETPNHAVAGKTSAHTDTFHGRFVELVPHERIVEVVEFESQDPTLAGEMTLTVTLADGADGTRLVACHDIPAGIRPEDNEAGWDESLRKLAALVERSARA